MSRPRRVDGQIREYDDLFTQPGELGSKFRKSCAQGLRQVCTVHTISDDGRPRGTDDLARRGGEGEKRGGGRRRRHHLTGWK